MTIKILFILMGATRSKFQNNLATCCDIQFLSRFFCLNICKKKIYFYISNKRIWWIAKLLVIEKKKKWFRLIFVPATHITWLVVTERFLIWTELNFSSTFFLFLLLLLLPVPLKMKNSFLPATKFQILTFHFCLPVSRILKIRVSFLWK